MKFSIYLNGCGPEGEDLVSRAFGVAVHVDEDVDPVGVDSVSSFAVANDPGKIDEVFRFPADLLSESRVVVGRQTAEKEKKPHKILRTEIPCHWREISKNDQVFLEVYCLRVVNIQRISSFQK